MVGVEIAFEVGQQWQGTAPEKTVFTDQELHRAPPRAGLEQAAVVPQVQRGLPSCVIAEQHQNVEIPADAPNVVAVYGLVHVKSHRFVLGFFGSVPAPQGCHFLVCSRKPRVIPQRAVGKHGGAVLKSGGHRQHVDGFDVLLARKIQPFRPPMFPAVDQTLRRQVLVVQVVDASVRGFLAYELRHGGAQLHVFGRIGQQLGAVAHRVDKALLTHGEAHGKRVVILAQKRIATVPMAVKAAFDVDFKLADGELGAVVNHPQTISLFGFGRSGFSAIM